MVRREEEPWQNRATLLLDTRRFAHTVDPDGTLEWAIDATASIGTHLGAAGYAVQLLTERPTTRGDVADSPERIVDELAALTPSSRTDFTELASEVFPPRGVVVAVLGRCALRDLDDLNRKVPARARRMAILLDRGSARSGEPRGDEGDHGVDWLTQHGWQVTEASASDEIAQAWARLGAAAAARHSPAQRAAVPR